VLGNLLDQFEAADDFLFDSVHQVVMPSWHTGRVALLGDSAWCVTLGNSTGKRVVQRLFAGQFKEKSIDVAA
jgi:hypothetical protein